MTGCSIHAGDDGTTVLNYARWRDADAVRAMLADPEIRVHPATVRSFATAQPARYRVVRVTVQR